MSSCLAIPCTAGRPRARLPDARIPRGARVVEAGGDAERRALETFIAARSRLAYGARIRTFLPRLYVLVDSDGERLAAFGLRDAAAGPLFLEIYLDQPIEQVIGARGAGPVARQGIVEIGNLAGCHPGTLRLLSPLLGDRLLGMGYRWLVFTGSAQLINGFVRLGIDLDVLAPAAIERLPEHRRAEWGSYYDHAPLVVCADIVAGRSRLPDVAWAIE
jgi:hypothetical protein